MTTSPNRDTEKIDQKNLKSEVKSDESKMNGLEVIIILISTNY